MSAIKEMIVRLENELDNMIRMFAFAREALEREMLAGLSPGKHGLNEAITKKLKELTVGMSSMVESKIRYDKAKKELAKHMTPQEEMDAVVAYIANLPHEDWDRLKERIKRVGRWMS
jgi:hypothetical protein